MAFDQKNESWIADFSSDGVNITVPLASLPEVSAAEAATLTGDIRKLLFGLCEALWVKWNALPTTDRPTKMIITKSSNPNTAAGTLTHTYSFQFVTQVAAQDVVPE